MQSFCACAQLECARKPSAHAHSDVGQQFRESEAGNSEVGNFEVRKFEMGNFEVLNFEVQKVDVRTAITGHRIYLSYGVECVIITCGHLTNIQGFHGNCSGGL